MKKLVAILMLFNIIITNAQEVSINDIILFNSVIEKQDNIDTKIFDLQRKGVEFILKPNVYTQVACYYTHGECDFVENKYRIIVIDDNNCELLDSIYSKISAYWKTKEEWAKKYEPSGDFSVLSVINGFYVLKKDLIVPVIQTESQVAGVAYFIFWYKGRIYKIELIERSRGFGGLSAFVDRNLKIAYENKQLTMQEGWVKNLKVAKQLIKNKIKCN